MEAHHIGCRHTTCRYIRQKTSLYMYHNHKPTVSIYSQSGPAAKAHHSSRMSAIELTELLATLTSTPVVPTRKQATHYPGRNIPHLKQFIYIDGLHVVVERDGDGGAKRDVYLAVLRSVLHHVRRQVVRDAEVKGRGVAGVLAGRETAHAWVYGLDEGGREGNVRCYDVPGSRRDCSHMFTK